MIPKERSNEGIGAAPPGRALRVLIVDDDRDQVLTLMLLLRTDGHDTKACYSGTEARRCVRDYDPDVVLLDINLRGESGWDIAREIRAAEQLRGTRPVLIGITGEYTKGADRILAEMSGFDYYMLKPVDPKVLTTLLEQTPARNNSRSIQ